MAATGIDGGIDGGNATGGGGGDVTPPTITMVSPTPGVPPGQPGGVSTNWIVARVTPIVLRITDTTPGNVYQTLVVRYPRVVVVDGVRTEVDDDQVDEFVVYRRGAFRGLFSGSSFETAIAGGKELSVLPRTGWPNANALHSIIFELDALDAAGNLAA